MSQLRVSCDLRTGGRLTCSNANSHIHGEFKTQEANSVAQSSLQYTPGNRPPGVAKTQNYLSFSHQWWLFCFTQSWWAQQSFFVCLLQRSLDHSQTWVKDYRGIRHRSRCFERRPFVFEWEIKIIIISWFWILQFPHLADLWSKLHMQ